MRFEILFILIGVLYGANLKIINVCINPDWVPIEFRENGTPKGISIDILNYISKNTGVKFRYIYTKSWSESQKFLEKGKCDITPTAIKTIKREKYALFTKPYLNYDLAIITTYDKPYVTSLDAVIDKTITRKKGSGLITKLERLYPNVKIIKPNSFKEMFELVNDKKVYATIATLPVFAYYKKKYNLNNLKIAGFSGMKYPLRIMVRKSKPEIREFLDKELTQINPKFTQKVYEKWIIKIKPNTDYKKIFIISLSLMFVIIVILIWVYILYKKNKELERLSKVKSQFLANMSHEIKTPLNSIVGFVELLKRDTSKCREYIHIIDNSLQVLSSLLRDILNFSNLEKNKIDINNQKFKSKNLIDFILIFKKEAKNKGLIFDIEENLPKVLYGDCEKLKDIMLHLLDNAIKFTDNGEIKIVLEYEKDKLKIKVIDTGIGIEKDKIEEIFKPFVQLDDRINKEYEGVGIGLSIVKKLVDVLKGKIDVNSNKEKGSEFYVEIPIKEVKEIQKEYNYKKVLIVEDNRANQMFLGVILKQLHLDYDIAQNGQIAVDMYKKFHYPLILMDINMPVMDGIEATRLIREYEEKNNLKPSRIIAITATMIENYKKELKKIKIDNYLAKPIDIDKLREVI